MDLCWDRKERKQVCAASPWWWNVYIMWTTSLGEACLPLRETLSPARQDGSWIECKNALRLLLSTPPLQFFPRPRPHVTCHTTVVCGRAKYETPRDLYPCWGFSHVERIVKNPTWLSSTVNPGCLFWNGQKRPAREREWSSLGSSPFMPSSSRITVPNHNKTLPVASKTWKRHHPAQDYAQHWLERDPELLPSDYQGPWVSGCLGFLLHQILWDTLILAWGVHHCPWWPPLNYAVYHRQIKSPPCLLKPFILHHLLQTVTFYISSVLRSALNPCSISIAVTTVEFPYFRISTSFPFSQKVNCILLFNYSPTVISTEIVLWGVDSHIND